MAGLDETGKLLERGDYFVPELMMAADAFKAGMEVLAPHLTGKFASIKAQVFPVPYTETSTTLGRTWSVSCWNGTASESSTLAPMCLLTTSLPQMGHQTLLQVFSPARVATWCALEVRGGADAGR